MRILPDLFAYGGWDWQHHNAEAPVFGLSAHVEDTGYAFGLRYVVPVSYRAKPWFRGGGLYNHVEIEGSSDGLISGGLQAHVGAKSGRRSRGGVRRLVEPRRLAFGIATLSRRSDLAVSSRRARSPTSRSTSAWC